MGTSADMSCRRAPSSIPAAACLILLVLAVLLLAAGGRKPSTVEDSVNRLITMDGLRTMQIALELYRKEFGHYPESLEDILRYKNISERQVIEDAWGHQYHYVRLKDQYVLFSVGKDGKPFTGDDIYPEETGRTPDSRGSSERTPCPTRRLPPPRSAACFPAVLPLRRGT